MRISRFFIVLFPVALLILSGCLGDDNSIPSDYTEWYNLNQEYITNCETEMEEGIFKYEKIVPVWDNSVFVLMHWYNDRSENVNKLNPVSNSTITVKYTLTNIEGDTLDSNSAFVCQPNSLITGFWTAVTNMNVKDTVTAVIPYTAGYGATGSSAIKPYSTLIFGIRLDSINKLY